jgi:glutamyl-Q tRNA(Asp) synthetase
MTLSTPAYVGRFAPSPTGPLHAGSLVAALASWLDARAHGGRWLLRIEDIDPPRCAPGADTLLIQQLAACGLQPDRPRCGSRSAMRSMSKPCCACATPAWPTAAPARASRSRRPAGPGPAAGPAPAGGLPRHLPPRQRGPAARAWRLNTARLSAAAGLEWQDRRLGAQRQDVQAEVGDFVLRRADGLWAYQLAVVVDDAEQGITDMVRGADLADNTARQILLQRAWACPRRAICTPRWCSMRAAKSCPSSTARPRSTPAARPPAWPRCGRRPGCWSCHPPIPCPAWPSNWRAGSRMARALGPPGR